uniref:WASP homolog associated with actin, golgi membranes and microtubules n=1 Tax=Oryctolagus cuniculus TaxID=9986 RepID=A0A5F9DJW4_RABIT
LHCTPWPQQRAGLEEGQLGQNPAPQPGLEPGVPAPQGGGLLYLHFASQILQGHGEANTMVALMKVYQEEDEAYQELVTVATTLFQYLLQPFRDMREAATSCKLGILKSLDEDDLGPKRVAALQKEAKEWARQAKDAVVSIQDITVNYFKETVAALAGMQRQMEQDKKRFGQAAWATAAPRLEKLKLMLARETLQLMRAKELCLNQQRAEIRGKMEDLPEQAKNIDVVDELEIQYYEIQLELYEVKFEILRNEEILLTTQLDSIKRLIKEKQNEVVYYDPCENPEDLKAIDQAGALQDEKHLEVCELGRQRRQLESRRGSICARRARLRNRKDQCQENHRLRLQQAEESRRYVHQHHGIQRKRDKMKEEEQKNKEWINQERQKTLQRLRAFKEVRSGHRLVAASTPSLSLPHPHPTPPPPHPPRPRRAPPPPLPALPTWSQAHPSSHFRPTVQDDQPLPLVCEQPAQRPRDAWESHQGPGSMDEVLASLRRGRTPLRSVDVPAGPPPRAAVNEHILAAIRQGVKLKKVHRESSPSPSQKPASDLERSIKAALQRIKRVAADSEEELESGEEEEATVATEQSQSEWDQ